MNFLFELDTQRGSPTESVIFWLVQVFPVVTVGQVSSRRITLNGVLR